MEINNYNVHIIKNNKIKEETDVTNKSIQSDLPQLEDFSNPTEYLGRSQVVFSGRKKDLNIENNSKDLKINNIDTRNGTNNSHIRELSDTEFESMKPEIEAKLTEKNIYFEDLNKYNIQLAEKILSDENLYNNDYLPTAILWGVKTAEVAELRYNLTDKIMSDKKLSKNTMLMDWICDILSNTNSPEPLKLADKILSDEKLYKNEDLMNNATKIIRYIQSTEGETLADKILSDEKLYGNEILMNNAGEIIHYLNTAEQQKIADKILSDEKLYGNENLMNNAGEIIHYVNTAEQQKIADKVLSDEKLYGNEILMNNAGEIIHYLNTAEQQKIADKILSDEKLYGNENLMNNAGEIIRYVNTAEQQKIADKILSDEKLYGNENLMNNAGEIIHYVNTAEQQKIADKILLDEKLYGNKNVLKSLQSIRNDEHAKITAKLINTIISNESMYENDKFMEYVPDILKKIYTEEDNKGICTILNKILSDDRLYGNKNFMNHVGAIISEIDGIENVNIKFNFLTKILSDEKLYKNENVMNNLGSFIGPICTAEQQKIADKILSDEKLYGNENFMNFSGDIINDANTPEIANAKMYIIDKILSDEKLYGNEKLMNKAGRMIFCVNTVEQQKIADKILSDEKLYGNENFMNFSGDIINDANTPEIANAKMYIIDEILSDEKLYGNENFMNWAANIIGYDTTPEIANARIYLIDKILSEEKLCKNENFMSNLGSFISPICTAEQQKIAAKILSEEKLYGNKNFMDNVNDIIRTSYTPEKANAKIYIIDKILSDEKLYKNENVMNNLGSFIGAICTAEQQKIADKILSDEKMCKNENFMSNLGSFISPICTAEEQKIADKILSEEKLYGNKNFMDNVNDIIRTSYTPETANAKIYIIDKILLDEKLYKNENVMNNLGSFISPICTAEQQKIADKILSDEKLYGDENLMNNSGDIVKATNNDNIRCTERLCADKEIDPKRISLILDHKISEKQTKDTYKTLGYQQATEISNSDFSVAANFTNLYGKTNINEIPISEKKEFLRNLVAANTDLFNTSQKLHEKFPLLPQNAESYCTLLPELVRSIGVETNTLKPEQVDKFNIDLQNLSNSLAKFDDAEFSNLKISQEYSTNDFTYTVLDKVKDLSSTEQQKVYDYFGFELHQNKNNETGYSIVGYPINLNNGKKLAQITDPKTKNVVESLRPEVIKFSEQNPIKCNNTQIEQFMNEIITVLPELRTTIGRKQHSSHDFDVMQHSLKVMQKISQTPNYNKLGDSDKKIMLLAALMHDITKTEGYSDKTHADNSSFDSFFITKKFNLSKDEEIKLFTLIKNHEWLENANTSNSKETLTKRLHDIAYDLRHDNVFDMILMFTHADLRAVKADDSFHDTTVGKSRIDFNGNVRSFGESADVYAERIRGYIDELKTSQPILPVTKFPAASSISHRITQVNSDGSTNIKGVYKNNDGLVIIKYNEVEDWEALGFPKGTDSRGIMAKGINGKGKECNVETGNIKFFVHGLDYENQLTKFDAFGLIDSDALLSVSYAERPESKYRFFRPQGVILDVNTKYIHGGGNTDAGSGYGKNINQFKNDYIFGGMREFDRLYISDMVKKATGMNDTEYVEFVKANENKSMLEIEPAELREKIIKAFATINSNSRKGNREYNEMYISNPQRVMGVFAYSVSDHVGNVMEFVDNQKSFLKDYAIQKDIPFVVFGD